ncbi:uncharacterized protein MONBRDRAFT_6465 [Monosiga brevicollis MX1]|uniref:Cyclin N-terminal domain-containing protein n=1 Tax=Monosiga brevicollis TaxID=81824 RepID=A9UTY7_MONBE|nr:uncharacterized protein MONBRDRAFT_6465 [Monosiga brevicollis MX1]EDQ91575.1 predicted protein [Monosiga brevicollis MX1]|eukprot:XP_001743997.1 hypothetical protein [Monosiga brevicollis MX1]
MSTDQTSISGLVDKAWWSGHDENDPLAINVPDDAPVAVFDRYTPTAAFANQVQGMLGALPRLGTLPGFLRLYFSPHDAIASGHDSLPPTPAPLHFSLPPATISQSSKRLQHDAIASTVSPPEKRNKPMPCSPERVYSQHRNLLIARTSETPGFASSQTRKTSQPPTHSALNSVAAPPDRDALCQMEVPNPQPSALLQHPGMSPSNFAIVHDWLQLVAADHGSYRKTYYLAKHILNASVARLVPKLQVQHLQLFAATAYWIANKLEHGLRYSDHVSKKLVLQRNCKFTALGASIQETFPIKLDRLCALTKHACSAKEILCTERRVMMGHRLHLIALNRQLLDVATLDMNGLRFRPAVLVAAALAHHDQQATPLLCPGTSLHFIDVHIHRRTTHGADEH